MERGMEEERRTLKEEMPRRKGTPKARNKSEYCSTRGALLRRRSPLHRLRHDLHTVLEAFSKGVHPGMRGSIQSVLEGACSEGSVLLPFPSVILAGNSEKWDEREQEESKAFYFPCT